MRTTHSDSVGPALRRAAAQLLILVAFLGMSACGYSLAGRGSFLPSYINTIGVPTFTNQTAVFDVEQMLTQRVRAEFIGRGKYRVVPDTTGVDALLMGTIKSITVTPAAVSEQGQATRYAVAFTLDIEFRDLREDRVLWENPSLIFREEYEITTVTTAPDPAAFFGQASNAVERIANDFAKSVVSSILEAF